MVLLLAVAAGLAFSWVTARTGVERVLFQVVMRGFANPPFFVSGEGGHGAPWVLRTLASVPRIDSGKAPVVVSLGDDPEGVFQSSPPSPSDLAVVLGNLQRLGARHAAVAAVLAWESPDPVALKGLEMKLAAFDMVVQAAPLSRGTIRQPMPPAFRSASLRLDALKGDAGGLPVVNRLAVPHAVFGGERALAGFSTLDDADPTSGRVPLLARWEEEERVVLAFPLLAVLARFDLPVEGVRVRMGEFLELGPKGPVVPIDRNGCLALPAKPVAERAAVPAEELIDGDDGLFPEAPGLIVVRDDQTAASQATRRFSADLASLIASISSDAGLGEPVAYRRLAAHVESALWVVLAGLGLWWGASARFARQVGLGAMAAVCLAAPWLGVGIAGIWLPGWSAAVALGVAMLVGPALDQVVPPRAVARAAAGEAAADSQRAGAASGEQAFSTVRPSQRTVTLRREHVIWPGSEGAAGDTDAPRGEDSGDRPDSR